MKALKEKQHCLLSQMTAYLASKIERSGHFASLKEVPWGLQPRHPREISLHFLSLFSEIARVQSGRGGSGAGLSGYREPIKYVDVYRERPIRLTVRVLVPVREHPKVVIKGVIMKIQPERLLLSVQFRWKASGSQGKLNEATARRDHDQNGCARPRINER